jgi:hypothetical protein
MQEQRESHGRTIPAAARVRCFLALALWILTPKANQAEVLSLTIGVDVNSPYGISEPWAIIREGLQRLDFVDSISALPDRKTATGELRTRHGRVPDVNALALALKEIGAGATLRGVEATAHGRIFKEHEHVYLKLSKTGDLLRLAPATTQVRRNTASAGSAWIDAERDAFTKLMAHLKGEPLEVRITGSLRAGDKAGSVNHQILEVRLFDLQGSAQKRTTDRHGEK